MDLSTTPLKLQFLTQQGQGSARRSLVAKSIASFLLAFPLLSCVHTPEAQAIERSCDPQILVDDMTLPHEGEMVGVPKHFSWAQKPEMGMGNHPGKNGVKFRAAMPWGGIREVVGNQATNTRVQLRNIKGYYLSKSSNEWVLISKSESIGGANFRSDFKGNASVKADTREEATGGLSIKLVHGEDTTHTYHFWAQQRGTIDPDDIAAVYASFEARLVVDDPSQPDDRHKARYSAGAGMDYWLALKVKWDDFKTNGDVFIGRKRLVGKEWSTLTASNLTAEQLKQNLPPFRGEFCP